MIITEYKDFILEFTDKYYSKVSTGECLVPASEFSALLTDWKNRQTPEKQQKLKKLEFDISQKMKRCKEKK